MLTQTEYTRKYKYGEIWKKIWIRDKAKCQICSSKKDICIDHKTPIKAGGKHTEDNMRLLCRSCNSKNKKLLLKQDIINRRNREYLKKFREKNPGYFKKKV